MEVDSGFELLLCVMILGFLVIVELEFVSVSYPSFEGTAIRFQRRDFY